MKIELYVLKFIIIIIVMHIKSNKILATKMTTRHATLSISFFSSLTYFSSSLCFIAEKYYSQIEKQRYDGWYNNLAHPQWGAVGK